MIERIISGGQTGVDRGALDAALAAGFPCGGWCPRGRRAEDGVIDARYPLIETPGRSYIERTRANVRQADATLVLCFAPLAGGTKEAVEYAGEVAKPVLVIDLAGDEAAAARLARINLWLDAGAVRVLNVAGPRESGHTGIRDTACNLVRDLIAVQRAGSV